MSNEHERSSNSDQHRFFHTMVLMGGALAVSCGGMSADADGAGGRSGAGGSGGTGPAGTGGAGGTTGGVAGMAGMGGSFILPTGGRMTVDPGPFTCTPAQWDCSSNPPNCRGDSFSLPAPDACRCDETRPKALSDCPADQVFACRIARYNDEGQEFSSIVPFECACVADQLDCGLVCMELYENRGECDQESDGAEGKSVLCGCALIVLR